MIRHILHRLLTMIPVWFLLSVMSFSLIHLSPSDPARLILGGTDVSQADVTRLNHQLGLDQPLPVQYLIWLKNALHGDWGYSSFLHASVLQTHGGSRSSPSRRAGRSSARSGTAPATA